jgi:tetratricopeptide (TPR) repeat protein
MGQLALGLGRLEEAEQHYLNAIAENANFAEAQLGLATVYLKGRRWDNALEVLGPLAREVDVIESAVERGRVFSSLGTAYQALGQAARAREAFEAALRQDPRNAQARDALA